MNNGIVDETNMCACIVQLTCVVNQPHRSMHW